MSQESNLPMDAILVNDQGQVQTTDDAPVVLHFQIKPETNPANNIADLADIQYIQVGNSNGIYTGNEGLPIQGTYIFNQETGEIQCIDLGESTAIDNNQVEIVTVDSKAFGDFHDSSANSFQIVEPSLTASRSSLLTGRENTKKVSASPATSVRSKNGPALLRNSRRVATSVQTNVNPTRTCTIGTSKGTQVKSSRSKPVSRSRPKSTSLGSNGQQVFILGDGDPSHFHVLDKSQNLATDNSGREGIFIFQNIGADSATDIFADNSVIFQLDNDGDSMFLNNANTDEPPSKQQKLPKKKSKKKDKASIVTEGGTVPKKANKGGGASELKCLEAGCIAVAYNLVELRKHLTNCHDMTFDLERKEFSSDVAFKEWRIHYERDRMVSFIYRGGTKKISKDQSVTYMICHRTGHYKPTMTDLAKRKRKMKPQGSCKIGGYCTAGIKLVKNLETGAIHADICHTHYGHPLDSEAIPHLRVNPVLKKMIIKKFEEGMNFADMLAYIHHNPDGLEGLRVLDRRAIRNIYDTWKKALLSTKEESPRDENSSNPSNPKSLLSLNDEVESEEVVLESELILLADNNELSFDEDPLSISIDSVKSLKPMKGKHSLETKSNESVAQKCSLNDSPEKRRRREEKTGKDNQFFNLSISTELEAAVDRLHNHGEAGPSILLYKRIGETNTKYGGFCRAFRDADFCLIIQTPVQRQIFQLFPKIFNVEIVDSPNPQDSGLKLVYASVLDDYREAIPIAWMICDSIAVRYFNQFFRVLRYHCGELSVHYLMAPRNVDILKAWTSHFSHKPKILQSDILVKRDLRNLLNRHFPNDSVRSNAWTIVESMINERKIDNLKGHKANLEKVSMKRSSEGNLYFRKMVKDWLCRMEEWSLAYRVGATMNLHFVTEDFLKLRKFVSFKGTKRLNQSIDHIMKIGYDKCFLRTKRLFKGDQKLSNLLGKLTECHKLAASSLKNARVKTLPKENSWIIEVDGKSEEIFHLQSPCDCKIRCKICSVCVHEYMCTCEKQPMCTHIHKIHCICNNIPMLEDKPEEEETVLAEKTGGQSGTVPESQGKTESIVVGQSGIALINENDFEALNITEVLGLLTNQDGQEMSKIVSITDAETQKVIYDGGNNTSPLTVFQVDSD